MNEMSVRSLKKNDVPPHDGMTGTAPLPATDVEAAAPVDLLYILGTGRCGTTFLDVMLGQQEGLWTVGEVHLLDVWLNGDNQCGCGLRVAECGFWRGVLSMLPPTTTGDVGLLRREPYPRGKALRWRFLLGDGYRREGERYRAANIDLLRAVRTRAAAAGEAGVTLIDASKDVYRLNMLTVEQAALRIKVVHVWRDPMGFVGNMVDMQKPFRLYWVARYALRWMIENRLFARAAARVPPERRMTLHFDQFLRDYGTSLPRLVAFAGGRFDAAKASHTRHEVNHGISGNSPRWNRMEPRVPKDGRDLGGFAGVLIRLITGPTLRRLKDASRC